MVNGFAIAQSDTLNNTDAQGWKQGRWIELSDGEDALGCTAGTKIEEGIYKDNRKVGVWRSFWCTGKIKYELVYNADRSVSSKDYYPDGKLKEAALREWGMVDGGTVKVTALDDNKFSYMDKIILLDSTAEHNQILYPKLTDDDSTVFAFTQYDILEIQGMRTFSYENVYFDTVDYFFYHQHLNQEKNRTKIRTRKYVDSHLDFVEYKQKINNVIKKERISIGEEEF